MVIYEHSLLGLAISGGVDSMALAALCSRIQHGTSQGFASHIGQAPLSNLNNLKFRAFVVDHGVRQGSNVEAEAVSNILESRGDWQNYIEESWETD